MSQDVSPTLRLEFLNRLNGRRQRIARLLVQGFSNGEMAKRMGTSEHVIKNQISEMRSLCGAESKLHLAMLLVSK